MRLAPARHHSVRFATLAVSVALLAAACATGTNANPGTSPTASGTSGPAPLTLTPGTLLVSDGTSTVRIGDATVTFPGPVTDAVWSPNGSRIAYIDGNGNVATAKPDGTDVLVLTQTNPSLTRSRPSWLRQWLLFAEKKSDGTSAVMTVPSNGCGLDNQSPAETEWSMDTGPGTSYVDLAPSGSDLFRPTEFAFQHDEPSGHQIWINDSNQRTPSTYKEMAGSEPALSLDANHLAYVGSDGAIYAATFTKLGSATGFSAATKISASVSGASHLTWNIDGSRLAYETSTDIEEIAVGAGSKTPTVLSTKPGVPSYLGGTPNIVNTITGGDPTALSVAASRARWGAPSQWIVANPRYVGAFSAIVTTVADIHVADDIHGINGPILVVSSGDTLDQSVQDELRRVFGTIPHDYPPPFVYITSGVGASVTRKLQQLGYHVVPGTLGPAPTFAGGTCVPQAGTEIYQKTLTVVDGKDAAAVGIAASVAHTLTGPLLSVNGPLTNDQIAYLSHSAGAIDTVDVIGAVPADVVTQIANLVSGSIAYHSVNNPLAPSICQATACRPLRS
jgi:hypothetical protein